MKLWGIVSEKINKILQHLSEKKHNFLIHENINNPMFFQAISHKDCEKQSKQYVNLFDVFFFECLVQKMYLKCKY